MYDWKANNPLPGDASMVTVDTRVVASGIEFEIDPKTNIGKRKLKMTLVLSPAIREDPKGTTASAKPRKIRLEDWPKEIEERVKGNLQVWVSPVRIVAGDMRPMPSTAPGRVVPVTVTRASKVKQQFDPQINTAWQYLMAPLIEGPPPTGKDGSSDEQAQWKDPWGKLVEFIKENDIAKTTASSQSKPGGDQPNEPAAVPAPIDDHKVISVPRSDIALFLSIWRARIMLAALDKTQLKDPLCDRKGVRTAWELQPGTIDLVTGWETSHDPIKTRLKAVLDAARAHTTAQRDARAKYVASTTITDAFDALKKLDQESEAEKCRCSAPAQLLDAVALTDKDALDQLLMRYLFLQETDLMLDEHLAKGQEEQAKRAKCAAEKLNKGQSAGNEWVGEQKTTRKVRNVAYEDTTTSKEVRADHWERPPVGRSHYVESRFFSLQSSPALARVFNFVVEVEADLAHLALDVADAILEADTIDFDVPYQQSGSIPQGDPDTRTHYLFVACNLLAQQSSTPPDLNFWTTAKLRIPKKDFDGHFFPCTREEIDLAVAIKTDKPDKPENSRRQQVGDLRDLEPKTAPERIMLPTLLDGAIRQFDGVVDLGAGRRQLDHKKRRPRFDIVSLESIGALRHQLEVIRSLWVDTPKDKPKDDPPRRVQPKELAKMDDMPERPTLMTEGVVLIDRWRAADYAAGLADQSQQVGEFQAKQQIVLDANDLSIGYRLDIGVRPKLANNKPNPRYAWRSLGARHIHYEYARNKTLIEAALTRLGYGQGHQDRIRLDAAPVVPVARRAPDSATTVFPEEIVASWNGEPMGIQCRQEQLYFDPRKGFGISTTYSYPEGDGYRIPRLKFGGRYRLGLRQIYLGGVVARLARAAAIYDEAAGGTLALPGAAPPEARHDAKVYNANESSAWEPAKPDIDWIRGRRFLRHERLKAPQAVLTRKEVDEFARRERAATRVPDGQRNAHFFGYPLQGAGSVVLRTALKTDGTFDETLATDSVLRMIVPPNEPQDFALRHGVFPDNPRIVLGPPPEVGQPPTRQLLDGLPNVRFDAERGGFPIRVVSPEPGKNVATSHAAVPKLPEKRPDDDKYCLPLSANASDDTERSGGDAVFEVQRTTDDMHGRRKEKYFPDPAARYMVLAVRRINYGPGRKAQIGEDSDYLEGTPLVVDLAQTYRPYPNRVAPLLIEVRRGNRDSAPEQRLDPLLVTQDMILAHCPKGDVGVIDAAFTFKAQSLKDWNDNAAETPVLQVHVNLLPGEDYYLDIWCLPRDERLAQWFDVIESSAMLSVARGRDMGNLEPSDKPSAREAAETCVAGLKKLAGDVQSLKEKLEQYAPEELVALECGAGAMDLPCEAVAKEIARLVHRHMGQRPIREIAAVASLRLTHAVSAPVHQPAFGGIAHALKGPPPVCLEPTEVALSDLERTGLALVRNRYKQDDEELAKPPKAGETRPSLDDLRKIFVKTTPVEQWTAHEEHASDLLVGGKIRLDLETSHSAVVLADVAQPRTSRFDDPERGRKRSALGTEPALLQLPDGKFFEKSEQIYGFRVQADGRIQFALQREKLIRLDSLVPALDPLRRLAGNEEIDVLCEHTETGSLPGPMRDEISLKRPYVPSDTMARRLVLTLQAHSRFHDHFMQIKHKVDTAKGSQPGKAKPEPVSTNALERPVAKGQPGWMTSRFSTDEDEATHKVRFSGQPVEPGQVELWIPATERPKPIDPKSFVPAFIWRETRHVVADGGNEGPRAIVTANQRTVVRLRFRRPWFSSGEGERLGIVLWPPAIFDKGRSAMDADFAADNNFKKGNGKPWEIEQRVKKYMTRWGADPIAEGMTVSGTYIPLDAFADAFCGDRTDVERVSRVKMPLPIEAKRSGDNKQSPPDVSEVSLLTYEPRFDVRDETWFVDIEMASAGMANPFVRFGLVRYQPHAMPDLRVSEPTTTMVQVLPERDVTVRCTRERLDDRWTEVIHVDVEGPAAIRAAPEPGFDKPDNDLRHRPVLRPRLVCIETTVDGHEEVRAAECRFDPRWQLRKIAADREGVVVPRLGGLGLKWSHRFTLEPDELLKRPHVMSRQFRVVLDEVDLRLPALRSNEPGASILAESGPRFAATIDIPELQPR